jgi:hypothetical protein
MLQRERFSPAIHAITCRMQCASTDSLSRTTFNERSDERQARILVASMDYRRLHLKRACSRASADNIT